MVDTVAPAIEAEEVLSCLERLRSPEPLRQAELLTLWKAPAPAAAAEFAEFYRGLATRVLMHGEPLLACDIAAEGLRKFPDDLRLRQLQARALSRSGASIGANLLLRQIIAEGYEDLEALGSLGGTWGDLAAETTEPGERDRCLRNAAACYERAHALAATVALADRRAWIAINAAAIAVIQGDNARAQTLATETMGICRAALGRGAELGFSAYALYTAAAEAALIRGELDEAREWYLRAASEAPGRLGDVAATRRQAKLLLEHLRLDPTLYDCCLPLPRVVAFVGHMIDHPDRPSPRFPASLEHAVRHAIAGELDNLRPGYGFSSAACGGDILFLEAMAERDAEIHVVLPHQAEEFRRVSVEFAPDAAWGARFEAVLSRATRVIMATQQRLASSPVTYFFTNMLVKGLATIRARQLDTECCLLALWDGQIGDGHGGTATVVQEWRKLGHDVRVIDLTALREAHVVGRTAKVSRYRREAVAPELSSALPRKIIAVLFADVVRFSELSEEETEHFIEWFLRVIGKFVEETAHQPVVSNTWGDGFYFVFEEIESAGLFALDLCDLVRHTDWRQFGLPQHLSIRVALHAGPAYEFMDPITGRLTYIGSNVNRAARIEPRTPANEVYASQTFIAIAAAYAAANLQWDYVGQVKLPKEEIVETVFRLRRAATAAAESDAPGQGGIEPAPISAAGA
ncbi:MAG TPA: adenylate/guanylate cyclase domain-containing protein [Stellaceae bacterium]|nr:adenylate/guanylate cyclase domain-containing protein [Stellaceae bacterium]